MYLNKRKKYAPLRPRYSEWGYIPHGISCMWGNGLWTSRCHCENFLPHFQLHIFFRDGSVNCTGFPTNCKIFYNKQKFFAIQIIFIENVTFSVALQTMATKLTMRVNLLLISFGIRLQFRLVTWMTRCSADLCTEIVFTNNLWYEW